MASSSPSTRAFLIFYATFLLLLLKISRTKATLLYLSSPANSTDRLALLAFKSNIKHDPHRILTSWNDSLHFCNWQGITCSKRHQRVTILDLHSTGLVGSLSPFLGNLSFLNHIDLANNTLQGKIPGQLGRLFRLQYLSLNNNSLEGEIPGNISHCSKLVFLGFGGNRLVGKLPTELFSLSSLKTLIFHLNSISGGIPSIIANLTSLERLSAAYNALGGSIPNSIGRLKNLKYLGLGGNELLGTLPSSIYNLSLISMFALSENQLTGTLPRNIDMYFPNLQFLQLNDNNLTGTVPVTLSNASNLETIYLGNNSLVGKLSVTFSGLRNLRVLSIHLNYLGSGEPDELNFLTQLVNCSKLAVISLNDNFLTGALPNSIGNLSTQLFRITFGRNQLFGTIPLGFGNLVGLTTLGMETNSLTGSIPHDITKLRNLQGLALGNNQLSGDIPSSIGNLSLLILLGLGQNRFQGAIPSSIGNCLNLAALSLEQNNLSGILPKQLFTISGLSSLLDISRNRLGGYLPEEIGKFKSLTGLDVSDNEFYGEIPSSIGSCTSLEYLFMQGNIFQGSIPPAFRSLRGLQALDVSRNNLSGQIPAYLTTISLKYLNLSFNNFKGRVPIEGVFSNTSTISVVGNGKLCGGISTLQLPVCDPNKSKQKKTHLLQIVLSVCISFSGVVVLLTVLCCWLKKSRIAKPSESELKGSLLEVSYGDLLKATDGFSAANLIGVGYFGSVYKGNIARLGGNVAIKVLNLQHRGAVKSFTAECEALRNIRHRNLLKIITSCSSIDFQGNDFKALVYEFMPKGSLERWLQCSSSSNDNSQNKPRFLNLIQRVNIAIDVACAIDYLHNQCHTPIVHCDLKPSNILLDNDITAHVGDFGIAKFLPLVNNSGEASSMGVRGTIGYAAPEYGQGSEVSTFGDIYSYGILLLEMITGKRPTDDEFVGNLNLHTYAQMAMSSHVIDVVDPLLISNQRVESDETKNSGQTVASLISLLKVGVACSVEPPHDRIDIGSVLNELQHVRNSLLRLQTGNMLGRKHR